MGNEGTALLSLMLFLCWLLKPEFLPEPLHTDSVDAKFNIAPKCPDMQVADLHTWLNKSALHSLPY